MRAALPASSPHRAPPPLLHALPPPPPTPPSPLAGCDWLAGCPATVLAELAAASTVVALAPREELLRAGGPGDRVSVLLSGRLSSVHDAGRGLTAWLCVAHEPLTTFGLENVLAGMPFLASLGALDEPTTVLTVPGEAVLAALAAHPPLGLPVSRHLARRVQWAAEQAVDLAVLDVRRRVAKYLVLRVDAAGRTPGLRQLDLARRLGASRQSINAAASSFVQRGWLSPPGPDGSHRVLDRAALAACAGNPVPAGGDLLH